MRLFSIQLLLLETLHLVLAGDCLNQSNQLIVWMVGLIVFLVDLVLWIIL